MPIIPHNGKVAVIGAGVSGLCYSYFLRKLRPDIRVCIYERALEPGGWIKTLELQDQGKALLLEKGPRTLRGVSDGTLLIVDILRQLNLQEEVEVMKSTSSGNRKWLLDNSNKLVQVPNSIILLAKFLVNDTTDGAIQGILTEPFRRKTISSDDESIESFVLRRLGSPKVANNIISAIMHGIYSGDVAKLSVKSTMPSLATLEAEYGSVIKAAFKKAFAANAPKQLNPWLREYEEVASPDADFDGMSAKLKSFPILRLRSGLQAFPRALAQHLAKDEKVTLRFNTKITELNLQECQLAFDKETSQKYDHIRFNAGFKPLQKVANIACKKAYNAMNNVEYSTIFLANVYTKNQKLIPKNREGFGFLVPKKNKNPQSLLGVIYDSCTETETQNFFNETISGSVPYTKLTLMMGGHFFNERGIPSTLGCLRAAKSVLQDILEIDLSQFNIVLRDEANTSNRIADLSENDLLISFNLLKNCIPLYNVGFSEIVSTVVDAVVHESHGTVSLGGPNMGKLGIPDCVVNELEAALNLRT